MRRQRIAQNCAELRRIAPHREPLDGEQDLAAEREHHPREGWGHLGAERHLVRRVVLVLEAVHLVGDLLAALALEQRGVLEDGRVVLLEGERARDGAELREEPVAHAHLVGEEVARPRRRLERDRDQVLLDLGDAGALLRLTRFCDAGRLVLRLLRRLLRLLRLLRQRLLRLAVAVAAVAAGGGRGGRRCAVAGGRRRLRRSRRRRRRDLLDAPHRHLALRVRRRRGALEQVARSVDREVAADRAERRLRRVGVAGDANRSARACGSSSRTYNTPDRSRTAAAATSSNGSPVKRHRRRA